MKSLAFNVLTSLYIVFEGIIMRFYEISTEVAEKRRWRYKYLVRPDMRKRFKAILSYAGYTVDDLACLLEVLPETIEKYIQDCTKIPIDDLWLIALY